ncbi:MAG TPA: TPM domain-containing protein [Sphingomonas sp.]|nr:TPM domain-containing protein [Sphingomonas sp.]
MLSEADRVRVGEAVTRAESLSDGEIVTVVAEASDAYHDVVLHWALLLLFLWLAVVAALPRFFTGMLDGIGGGWSGWSAGELLAVELVAAAALFLIARYLFGLPRLRLLLTPDSTKARRVRRRAVLLFRLTADNRTRARTGVLLYLSIAERRAEIVADASINDRVTPEIWGEAMHALIAAVKDGRAADGMVAAVERMGAVLAEHFPRSADDTNELPDRLILL